MNRLQESHIERLAWPQISLLQAGMTPTSALIGKQATNLTMP
jgi:hypothetical protein